MICFWWIEEFLCLFSPRMCLVSRAHSVWEVKAGTELCECQTATSTGKTQGWRCAKLGFLTQLLLARLVAVKILTVVSPVLLREFLHRAAIWLQLLVQATAVDEDGLARLGVPSSLPKHLLQLLKRVAAFPLAHAVLLHAAVAPAQSLRERSSSVRGCGAGWAHSHSHTVTQAQFRALGLFLLVIFAPHSAMLPN